MRRPLACSLAASLVVLVAACPARRPAAVTAASGAGCPSAAGVYVASYVQPAEGETGHTGWVLPLHAVPVPSVEGRAGYETIDFSAASAAGVPAAPTPLWVLPPNAAMCQVTVGDYYAAAIDEPPHLAYGVELVGCPAPTNPADATAIVLVSAQAPTGCTALPPRPVAARLGDTDAQGTWTAPTQATPIPPALAAIIPERACVAPGCEKLWSIAQVEHERTPVAWAGAVNWLTVPAGATPATQCTWPVETFSGMFVAGPSGAPVKVTAGQERPLALTAVLADARGPQVLLAEGVGEYATYDLAGGGATLVRKLTWLRTDPADAGGLDRIGPDCGATEVSSPAP